MVLCSKLGTYGLWLLTHKCFPTPGYVAGGAVLVAGGKVSLAPGWGVKVAEEQHVG